MKLLNSFSISMIRKEGNDVSFVPLTLEEARGLFWPGAGGGSPLTGYDEMSDGPCVDSYVGHKDTAQILSGLLEFEVPVRRASADLTDGSPAVVAQYAGPRLPEGATMLPEGATIQFWIVRLFDRGLARLGQQCQGRVEEATMSCPEDGEKIARLVPPLRAAFEKTLAEGCE
jgi:hypothetical protein